MQSTRAPHLAVRIAAALTATVMTVFPACALISSVDDLHFVAACTSAADCDDGNPCTSDTCDPAQQACVHARLDGVPTPGVDEPKGDCKVHRCVAGEDVDAPDDTDAPTPASNCETDSCAGGAVARVLASAGTPCTAGVGVVCDGAGACVGCNVDADCPGATDDCQRPVCRADHSCGTKDTAFGTATSMSPLSQVPGDCHTIVCDGQGGSFSRIDDTDLPDDHETCTSDLCAQGVPSHASEADGWPCGIMLTCSMGACTGCTIDAQCIMPQTCGGGGKAHTCGCTPKTCADLGATCGVHPDGCGGTVSCGNGAHDNGETDVDCGGACATPCANSKMCDVGADCSSSHCVDQTCCATGCASKCYACNLAGAVGTCSLVPLGVTDPDSGCSGAYTCNGAGGCLLGNGQSCNLGTQCASTYCFDGVCCDQNCGTDCQSCNLVGSVGTCSKVPKGQQDGNCVAPKACDASGGCAFQQGHACTAGSDCALGFCISGYCCGSSCATKCHACNLLPGTCTATQDGVPGPLCPAPQKCVAGACM